MKDQKKNSRARFVSVIACAVALLSLPVMEISWADETSPVADEFDWLFSEEKPEPALGYSLGVTYDYLSQTFYLLDTASDTLEVASKLSQEYLNQPALFFEGRYKPLGDDALRFVGYAENSEEYFRGRFESVFRSRNSASQVSGEFSLEGRVRNSGQLALGDEYGLARGRLKYRGRFGPTARGFIALRGEAHRLGNTPSEISSSVYTGDYNKLGAEAGLEFEVGQLDRLALSGSLLRREVSEREDLNYRLRRLRLEYSGFTAASFYALELSLENRDYDSSGNDNDQRRVDLVAAGEYRLASNLAFDADFRLEALDYLEDTSSFNTDQTLVDLEVKLQRRWGLTTLGFGAGLTILSQKDQPSAPRTTLIDIAGGVEELSEEYSERAAILSFEHFKLSRLMLTLENQLGFRDITVESDYQSDYWFDRVSLFASVNLTSAIKFDLISSLDFEWHDQGSDDNSLYMINSSFSYNFN